MYLMNLQGNFNFNIDIDSADTQIRTGRIGRTGIYHFTPVPVDLTCLLPPPVPPSRKLSIYEGDISPLLSLSLSKDKDKGKDKDEGEGSSVLIVLEWMNRHANTFRNIDGSLTNAGSKVEKATREQYTLDDDVFMPEGEGKSIKSIKSIKSMRSGKGVLPAECDRITLDEASTRFVKDYLVPQKPVIITDFYNLKPKLTSDRDKDVDKDMDKNRDRESDLDLDSDSEAESTARLLRVLHRYGSKRVGVKLADSCEFEGVESLHPRWSDLAQLQHIPPVVLSQLQSPELVVVRAAHEDMTLRRYLQLLNMPYRPEREREGEGGGGGEGKLAPTQERERRERREGTTAYVEYQSLTSHPNLLRDLLTVSTTPVNTQVDVTTDPLQTEQEESMLKDESIHLPNWLRDVTLNAKAHLWLGDGHTTGKLHFDPFDNILHQLSGSKTFFMADPSRNERFKEGHMREAELTATSLLASASASVADKSYTNSSSINKNKNRDRDRNIDKDIDKEVRGSVKRWDVKRGKLSESTSMVHSPYPLVDKDNDNERFQHISCTVRAGEALFVPSFWWHEVVSQPGPEVPVPVPVQENQWNGNSNGSSNSNLNENKNENGNWNGNGRDGEREDEKEVKEVMQMNLAINYWFDPLFDKHFPCSTCRKFFNSAYWEKFQEVIGPQLG